MTYDASFSPSCLLVTGVNRVELATMDLPAPQPHEVVVETLYSGISPGTELRCLAGRQELATPEPFPFVPGYSLVGRVVRPDAAGRLAANTVVYCRGTGRSSRRLQWGGHVGHAVVAADEALPVPAAVAPAEAALLRLAAISYRGFRLAKVAGQPTVAVVGLGPIGQLSARIFAASGARVLGLDVSVARVQVARAAGICALPAASGQLNDTVRGQWPAGADIVVDATGHPPVIKESLQLVRDRPWAENLGPGGRLIVQGSYRGDLLLPPEVAFAKELEIIWPRDCQREDLVDVLRLMERGELSLADLVGVPQPPEHAQQLYDELREQRDSRLTGVFSWRSHQP